MDTLPEPIAEHVISFVESLKSRFSIRGAYLFGSWAEGKQGKNSDIDIGIVLEGKSDFKDRLELFSLGKDYDVDFDVVGISEQDFESEDPVIVHEIKTKGKRIA
jgi:predicted nucleotidyltransferase